MKNQSHIVFYKGYEIVYFNGVYRIKNLPAPGYVSFTDAKNEIDKIENDLNDDVRKFFDNLKLSKWQNQSET